MGNEQLDQFEKEQLEKLRGAVDKYQISGQKESAEVARRDLEKFVNELREKGYNI